MQRLTARAQVPDDARGGRIDAIAARLFPEHSRSRLKAWIEAGALRVDGRVVRASARVRGGERIDIEAELAPAEDWRSAQPLAFEIVHADASVYVIDKPAGLVVHPGAGNPDGTLVNGLLARDPALADLPRAGIVHRLDADTTGLMVVARTAAARAHLVAALATRAVRREYLAVVEGNLHEDLDIDAPIGRHPRQRTRMAVVAGGRPARTCVQVRERFAAHTLVGCRLETGRTHQIRVHLASRGFPLAGDVRYGARGLAPEQLDVAARTLVREFPRQALHAAELGFEHPDGGQVHFSAPLPADLAALLTALRAGDPGT